ncbi:MAG TPA: hypothetical protein VK737_02650 [Opitutales bacterium]|jgi:hypothetical protein|nr:hypothetical protein [Opitutales bacterium]
MNLRHHFALPILLVIILTLGGWGGARAQLVISNWPSTSPTPPFALGFDPENGSTAADQPVPGFVGPAGDGVAPYSGANLEQQVNPAFVEWAGSVVNYSPANPKLIDTEFLDANTALGPVTGNVFDVVSLGDLSAADIAAGVSPGSITLAFATPIADGPGPDFVAFGNAFNVRGKSGTQVFSKLAYVEVSSDGVNFARFPSVDLNPKPTQKPWTYMVSNPTLIYNLFGKAVNAYGLSWGVPFDLAQLAQHPFVAAGLLDLQNIRYVRLVAVVGNGAYSVDAFGDPIYDPWPTTGSPGPEVQAIGVLNVASNTTAGSGASANPSSVNALAAGGARAPVDFGQKSHPASSATMQTSSTSIGGGNPVLAYVLPEDAITNATAGILVYGEASAPSNEEATNSISNSEINAASSPDASLLAPGVATKLARSSSAAASNRTGQTSSDASLTVNAQVNSTGAKSARDQTTSNNINPNSYGLATPDETIHSLTAPFSANTTYTTTTSGVIKLSAIFIFATGWLIIRRRSS